MDIEKKEPRAWKQYFLNIIHAVRGDENFTGNQAENVLGFSIFAILLILIIGILVCYGAARLSWCYGTYNGDSTTSKVIFSVLCFFFPNFYYPFYALFLNPVCGRTKNQSGGRR